MELAAAEPMATHYTDRSMELAAKQVARLDCPTSRTEPASVESAVEQYCPIGLSKSEVVVPTRTIPLVVIPMSGLTLPQFTHLAILRRILR